MINIRKDAVLDDHQKEVIDEIRPFTLGYTLEVTRGHASPFEQLKIIMNYAQDNGISFPEFDVADVETQVIVDDQDMQVYTWQRTWSKLLELYTSSGHTKGALINPPQDAVCLYDYKRPNGESMKGKVIHASPHIVADPCPIDFSAKVDGIYNLDKVAHLMQNAMDGGASIASIQPEPANSCVHLNIK